MAEINYPSVFLPTDRNFVKSIDNVENLIGTFYYFMSFPNETDDIVYYCDLWKNLNEIGKSESREIAPVLATCTATEIFRIWIETFDRVDRIYADNFFDLYKNFTKHIAHIDENSPSYMWKYNLFQTWAEKNLFSLDLVVWNMNEQLVEQLFINMFRVLLELGSNYKTIPGKSLTFVRKGLEQLVKCSSKIGKSTLREILMPLLTGNITVRLLIKECLWLLTPRQCQFLCTLISRRILLNHRCDLFDGIELRIAEKLLQIIPNFELFEPLVLVTTKACLNCFHREHERILRILSVLLIRYTEKYKNTAWDDVELDTRKKIQLMVSRFKAAMINSYRKLYPNVLLTYGPKLLFCAPTKEIKFRYLDIFRYYIKCCRGDYRAKIISIFDNNLN